MRPLFESGPYSRATVIGMGTVSIANSRKDLDWKSFDLQVFLVFMWRRTKKYNPISISSTKRRHRISIVCTSSGTINSIFCIKVWFSMLPSCFSPSLVPSKVEGDNFVYRTRANKGRGLYSKYIFWLTIAANNRESLLFRIFFCQISYTFLN